MKKNTIIITSNKFPDGDAGALRQFVFSKMFLALGYDVFVYGMGTSTKMQFIELDGLKYISLRGPSQRKINRICDRFSWDYKALADIKKRFERIDVILVIDDNPIFLKKIEKYCRHQDCILIHDSVEWYSPEEFKAGFFSVQYLVKDFINKHVFNKNWCVIAISSYLNTWFSGRVNKTVRIPVIMDMINSDPLLDKSDSSGKRIIVYAGSPGKKDYLKEIITGFSLLDKNVLDSFEFHIIGITFEQLISICGVDPDVLNKLDNSIYVHGRLSHQDALEWVKKADYTILLRNPDLRYAKAGFPTKIVESLMCGTPPICNISSDLGEYLSDGINSIIINSCSVTDVRDALAKALSICSKDQRTMQFSARETALECFNFTRYINDFADFLNIDRSENEL